METETNSEQEVNFDLETLTAFFQKEEIFPKKRGFEPDINKIKEIMNKLPKYYRQLILSRLKGISYYKIAVDFSDQKGHKHISERTVIQDYKLLKEGIAEVIRGEIKIEELIKKLVDREMKPRSKEA